jgi:hypothetical protein
VRRALGLLLRTPLVRGLGIPPLRLFVSGATEVHLSV